MIGLFRLPKRRNEAGKDKEIEARQGLSARRRTTRGEMDAPEDDLDIKLQRVSSELIATFDQRLPTLLRRSNGLGEFRVRSRVRVREAAHLMSNVRENERAIPVWTNL